MGPCWCIGVGRCRRGGQGRKFEIGKGRLDPRSVFIHKISAYDSRYDKPLVISFKSYYRDLNRDSQNAGVVALGNGNQPADSALAAVTDWRWVLDPQLTARHIDVDDSSEGRC